MAASWLGLSRNSLLKKSGQSHQQNLWAVKDSCSNCLMQSWRRRSMFLSGTPSFLSATPLTERTIRPIPVQNVLKWPVNCMEVLLGGSVGSTSSLHRLVGLRHPGQTAWHSQLKRASVPVACRLTSILYNIFLVRNYGIKKNHYHICNIKKKQKKLMSADRVTVATKP